MVNWQKQIDDLQKILVEVLESKILPQDSYLAGGTALYFYLNHRVSVDNFLQDSVNEKRTFLG